jgi:hypothetical protein
MNLHPDERPPDIETFRQSLLGNWTPPPIPIGKTPRLSLPKPTIEDILSGPAERTLAWILAGTLIFSLIVTLAR